MTTWDRLPPSEPCTSPDGHEHVDVVTLGSVVPEAVFCGHCSKPWTVVVYEEGAAP